MIHTINKYDIAILPYIIIEYLKKCWQLNNEIWSVIIEYYMRNSFLEKPYTKCAHCLVAFTC